MARLPANIKHTLTDTALFSACYCLTFLILIGTFSEGNQTTGMFILIDFFVLIILTIYYLIIVLAINAKGGSIGILLKAVLFFVLAELSVLTITGELPIFGLLQKYVYSKTPYSGNNALNEDIYLFRQTRDFAFSSAGFISAMFFLIIKRFKFGKFDLWKH